MKITLFLSLITSLLFIACSKDKKPESESLYEQRQKLLLDGTWHNVFRGSDQNGDGVLNPADLMENVLAECQLDDAFVFHADSTYIAEPGAETNGCGQGPYQGAWTLKADGKSFVFDGYTGSVDSLTAGRFRFYILLAEGDTSYAIFTR